ncbi:MAG: hypothetical protein IJR29_09865 [Butyrivibrio sp.]|nr:hypothetical protein [Butyrivibrio sp.]
MSKEQKTSLIAACIFYVLTIVGSFYFSLTLIIIVFLLFTLSMCYFSYLCYKNHNDYTGAEHLQQEIGLLNAENVKISSDYEKLIKAKDEELENRQNKIEILEKNYEEIKKAKEDVESKMSEISNQLGNERNIFESLLPSDEEDSVNIDIIEVARQAISEFSDAAAKSGLRIMVSSASDKIMIRASQKRILILFKNIIDNSIKYMQKEGTLVITISVIDNDIFIVLKDTGKGLPESETKHIFELNYQGSNRISGNGLGLTQAKAIVEHYGGTIYARSNAGNGMGIYIQLPSV